MTSVETLFLKANKAIDEKKLDDALHLLLELVQMDPGYGRAHNHIGWIFETKFKDFEKSLAHYRLAKKFCDGNYPVIYVNLSYLLIDFGQYEEALEVINEGLEIPGADMATLTYQKGKIHEKKLQMVRASEEYHSAKLMATNRDFFNYLTSEIERVQKKLSPLDRIFFIFKRIFRV